MVFWAPPVSAILLSAAGMEWMLQMLVWYLMNIKVIEVLTMGAIITFLLERAARAHTVDGIVERSEIE